HLFLCRGSRIIRRCDHCASDDLLSLLSFCPIVSSRVLLRSCCFSLEKQARSTFHDRTAAFTPPLLRGLGEIPAASCRGHRAPLSRAASPAHHAAPLVDWHVRDAYCR